MREYVGILNFFIYRATKPYARISIEWLQMLRDAIVTHTEPEDEPLLHGELHGYVSPDCGCKYCEYGRNQIALRKWNGFLEDTDYRELPDDMDIVDNLYRNWLQQEDK